MGIVLSGGTPERFRFIVLEDREEDVVTGKLVKTELPGGGRLVAVVEGLSYYHEFYEEGDVWVEAIKRGYKIQGDVARRYLLAVARSVGVLRGGGVEAPTRPPEPGSRVYLVGPGDVEELYGYAGERPGHLVAIGYLMGYEREKVEALLDLRAVTMHMAILGTTGSGKSNTMRVIIEQLGRLRGVEVDRRFRRHRTLPLLVVDPHGDYTGYATCRPDLVVGSGRGYEGVDLIVFPGSARPPGGLPLGARQLPLYLDLSPLRPAEIAEAVIVLARGEIRDTDMLQLAAIRDAVCIYMERYCRHAGSECVNAMLYDRRRYGDLESILMNEVEAHKATKEAARNKLSSFRSTLVEEHRLIRPLGSARARREAPFTPEYIDELTDPERPRLAILDLSPEGAPGVGLRVKQLVVYIVSLALFRRFVEYSRDEEGGRLLVYALEEAQNFVPDTRYYNVGYSLARGVLQQVATQGRKFGLSLFLITQRPLFVDQAVLSMMNTFIIHRVPPADVRFVSIASGGLPRRLEQRLTVMERGTAVLTGQMNPSPAPTVVRVWKSQLDPQGC